ncbi:RICIN domain-containing protein [Streptomyces sp. NPDC058000]|uniref:RICIN domain-containing protein n=1 Tax=Streptomyces sp. NPDC058000 TaxID=3346299 RepID=UPI0036EAF1A7
MTALIEDGIGYRIKNHQSGQYLAVPAESHSESAPIAQLPKYMRFDYRAAQTWRASRG